MNLPGYPLAPAAPPGIVRGKAIAGSRAARRPDGVARSPHRVPPPEKQ